MVGSDAESNDDVVRGVYYSAKADLKKAAAKGLPTQATITIKRDNNKTIIDMDQTIKKIEGNDSLFNSACQVIDDLDNMKTSNDSLSKAWTNEFFRHSQIVNKARKQYQE